MALKLSEDICFSNISFFFSVPTAKGDPLFNYMDTLKDKRLTQTDQHQLPTNREKTKEINEPH
jgi:hypothetical protein